eukprot:2577120-Pleurochrysis_carterae.AAC.1
MGGRATGSGVHLMALLGHIKTNKKLSSTNSTAVNYRVLKCDDGWFAEKYLGDAVAKPPTW